MNYEGNFHWQLRVVQQGPLESWKIETSFALTNNDSQQLIIVDMIYPIVQQRRFWPCNGTHMKLQSADVPQQALNSLCQFCKSVFFVVSLLEASPVHETLWDTKRGSPKVWKSDISCLMAILQMTREHFIFNAWKMTAVLE